MLSKSAIYKSQKEALALLWFYEFQRHKCKQRPKHFLTFTLALLKSPDALEASSNGTAPCSFASLKSSATILLGLLEAPEICNPLYSESPE